MEISHGKSFHFQVENLKIKCNFRYCIDENATFAIKAHPRDFNSEKFNYIFNSSFREQSSIKPARRTKQKRIETYLIFTSNRFEYKTMIKCKLNQSNRNSLATRIR